MSLYYEAASVLSVGAGEGSLRSRVYNDTSKLKSRPAQLYALITETAKYDTFLKEIVENAGILALEPKLTPLLSLLILHDHFFSKSGIAASKEHILKQAILRHKARLQAEFTKATRRRKCASTQQLVELLVGDHQRETKLQPRWARVNRLKRNTTKVLEENFRSYSHQPSLHTLMATYQRQDWYHIDQNVPDLLGLPPGRDLSKSHGYKNGDIILQDKASCFPAYLLLGEESEHDSVGDVIDACAAPGNKTTHLASVLCLKSQRGPNRRGPTIFACERDPRRSDTLQRMVNIAGADKFVTVLPRQDFFALDPKDKRFANVTHLLLDPSCSGSGIVGREDIPVLSLPDDPKNKKSTNGTSAKTWNNTKKRKRIEEDAVAIGAADEEEEVFREIDGARLEKLSNLQTRIIQHALSFPAARRITYSTCSIHAMENENVVARVLRSDVALSAGWRLLKREEQLKGMREWKHRGTLAEVAVDDLKLNEEDLIACIRCTPGTDDGTMGFFVCCFVREENLGGNPGGKEPEIEDIDGWDGFDD